MLVFVALAAGCGRVRYEPGERDAGGSDGSPRADASARDGGDLDASGPADAAAQDAAVEDAGLPPPACTPWTGSFTVVEVVRVDELATSAEEMHPVASADGTSLTFASARPGAGGLDLYVARRPARGVPFGTATAIAELNGPDDEIQLSTVPSGLEGVLNTNRPGGPGNADLWRVTRSSTAEAWTVVGPMPNVNSGSWEYEGDLSPDGLTLWFTAENLAGGMGGADAVVATRASTAEPFGPPTHVTEMSSANNDYSFSVSANGLFALVSSDRRVVGDYDIYYATRLSAAEPFSTPVPLDALNTTSNEGQAHITADGCEIFFATNRPGSLAHDIWLATIAGAD